MIENRQIFKENEFKNILSMIGHSVSGLVMVR